jgi:hypothetical protein
MPRSASSLNILATREEISNQIIAGMIQGRRWERELIAFIERVRVKKMIVNGVRLKGIKPVGKNTINRIGKN